MRKLKGSIDVVWFLCCLGLIISLTGCSSFVKKQRQIESVAKDWCLVIRASQVIPVYPLTEDLQPGDLFLVQRTIDDQQKDYLGKGFLPLDNHLFRLTPTGYTAFYKDSFGLCSGTTRLPQEGLTATPIWSNVAKAAFPSYSFSVKKGVGVNLALPVYGVPIGLSLLGSTEVEGSIILSDARTYGVDTISLEKQVRDEIKEKNLIKFLEIFGSTKEKTNYLRVISRVYLIGEVNISLQDSSAVGGGVSAGASPPALSLLTASDDGDSKRSGVSNYVENINRINNMLSGTQEIAKAEGAKPGIGVKIVSATTRSIGLKEKFTRPLIIGYLGFDMKIEEDGTLGHAIPTHALLTGELMPQSFPKKLRTIYDLRNAVEGHSDAENLFAKVLFKLDEKFTQRYNQESKGKTKDEKKNIFRKYLTEFLESEMAEEDGPLHRQLKNALKDVLD